MSNIPCTTIVASATPAGVGALAIVRLSGPEAISIANTIFEGKDLTQQRGSTLHFGTIGTGSNLLDEVVVSLFRAPHSFTREDSVEITCHGSPYIVQALVQRCLAAGAKLAGPGEFTKRAMLAGRFDLAQAEAVADLIHANHAYGHRLALQQMRGGFSQQLASLRQQLVNLSALLELELDFGEEDVTFADRTSLSNLVNRIQEEVARLAKSFAIGSAIKEGIPIALVGAPNVGKSTLLNTLMAEDRAIVSDIPGTTRDTIEASCLIEGMQCRFVDTAGLRETDNPIETLGIARTHAAMQEAWLILYVVDITETKPDALKAILSDLPDLEAQVVLVGNKMDLLPEEQLKAFTQACPELVLISAAQELGIESLKERLLMIFQQHIPEEGTIVTNMRHYEHLVQSDTALQSIQAGLKAKQSHEWLAQDLRTVLHHLGAITAEVNTEEVLGTIFEQFCIGK